MEKTYVIQNGYLHWYHNNVFGGSRKDTIENRKMLIDAGYKEKNKGD